MLKKFLNFYMSQKKDALIDLELIGGEPTLHPDIWNFCEEMLSKYQLKMKMFTNLTAPIENYKNLLKYSSMSLIASWHQSKNDKLNKLFIDKASLLCDSNYNQMEVRVMYEPNNTVKSIEAFKTLSKHTNPELFDFSLVFNAKDNDNLFKYTDEQMNMFNHSQEGIPTRTARDEFLLKYADGNTQLKSFNNIFCNKDYSFKRWLCNASINSLFINYDSLVYPCVEYSFSSKNSLFSIYSQSSWYIPKHPVVCKLDRCSCDWDIKKRKVFLSH